jgi:hypothetical protein
MTLKRCIVAFLVTGLIFGQLLSVQGYSQDKKPVASSIETKLTLPNQPQDPSKDKPKPVTPACDPNVTANCEKIQLTEVPEDEQKLLYAKGKGFTHRHWRVLSRIKDPVFLKELLKRTLEEQLSVSELERSLEAAGIPKVKKVKAEPKEPALWTAPISLDGTRIIFKSSNFDTAHLTPERKKIIKEEIEKILPLLQDNGPTL